jgi:uncharacterized protein (TIGR00375 family)
MKFIADLHIHSKYSRATAKNLDLENLYIAAQLKGITVVGTGDFTHPGWFSEIKEKLEPAEEGLYKLKNGIEKACDIFVPPSCRSKVRFMLVSEISNIYKKNDKTRKNHNLVFAPDLEAADILRNKLDKIGNIASDGRPILGLDAKALLEMTLETSDKSFLIPAHIWTPWFSVLGSKSGFNSIEACFEELTPYIFALETGLSSDPAMNWRVSGLDRFTLVSNSDAHSPMKLGREANLFSTSLNYSSIREALKTGDPERFLGTLEYYPEEGKYHLDGHRKCNVRLWPAETIGKKGICPECGKPMTLGVLYRVDELADRPEDQTGKGRHPFHSVIPLVDILSEIFAVGPGSKKVQKSYEQIIHQIGPEFSILHTMDPATLEGCGIPLLGPAIQRMRAKEVSVSPGYDGVFGKVKLFSDQEKQTLGGQKQLFSLNTKEPSRKNSLIRKKKKKKRQLNPISPSPSKWGEASGQKGNEKAVKTNKGDFFLRAVKGLNDEQRRVIEHEKGPLLIVAGPGTGKTHILTLKIAHLIKVKKVSPESILAVTFTNKASVEMLLRLEKLLGKKPSGIRINTFHAFCFHLIQEQDRPDRQIIDDENQKYFLSEALNICGIKENPSHIREKIRIAKQRILGPQDDLEKLLGKAEAAKITPIYRTYQNLLESQNLLDFEDIIRIIVRQAETRESLRKAYQERFKWIFVDEYQDLNEGQYRLIKNLSPPKKDLCVIGDPDQSIYGFRGTDVRFFTRFQKDYPDGKVISLNRNYRSAETILKASHQVIKDFRIHHGGDKDAAIRTYSLIQGTRHIKIAPCASEKAEAVFIGRTIEDFIGGMALHTIDYREKDRHFVTEEKSFADFAVLYRTHRQSVIFAEAFEKAGIPFQVASRKNFFRQKGISGLISLIKILEKTGSFADLEGIINLVKPGISRDTLSIFKHWAYEKNISLQEAVYQARRLPLPGMSNPRQKRFNDFIDQIFYLGDQIKNLPMDQKIDKLVNETEISQKIMDSPQSQDAVDIFKAMVQSRKKENVSPPLSEIALHTDTDWYYPQVEKVTLMTMHAAKGLEFPVVFIAGCEEGFIPYYRPDESTTDIDEERRLFYVAMTRAKEQLFLTYALKRRIFGRRHERRPSTFVEDIENALRKYEAVRKNSRKKKNQVQLELFNGGQEG